MRAVVPSLAALAVSRLKVEVRRKLVKVLAGDGVVIDDVSQWEFIEQVVGDAMFTAIEAGSEQIELRTIPSSPAKVVPKAAAPAQAEPIVTREVETTV